MDNEISLRGDFMNAYIVYPNAKNEEAVISLERNISKVSARLIKETISKKEYDDNIKFKMFDEVINFFAQNQDKMM